MDINLKIKLSAYSKLPILDYITDVSESTEDKVYGRKKGQWVELENINTSDILLEENSGLSLIQKDKDHRYLSIKQYIGIKPDIIEDDTTYYTIDNTPNIFINGGTSYSDGFSIDDDIIVEKQYNGNFIDGGNSNTINYSLELLPINAKGVLNV